MQPWAALIIGVLSGCLYVVASRFVIHVLRIDDPLDAVAVHAFCGTWGLISASLFAAKVPMDEAYGLEEYGLFMGGGWRLFAAACVTALAVIGWVLGHMIPFFVVLKKLGLFRVSEEEEDAGLDISHHMGVDNMNDHTHQYAPPSSICTASWCHSHIQLVEFSDNICAEVYLALILLPSVSILL
jgi:ammonium transporter, Amt family